MQRSALLAAAAATAAAAVAWVYRSRKQRTSENIVVSELWVFPVKGLGGIRVDTAEVVVTGFKWDRNWVVYRDDKTASVVRPPAHPKMVADIATKLTADSLVLIRDGVPNISIPLAEPPADSVRQTVELCDVAGLVSDEGDAVAKWLSDYFGFGVRLGRIAGHRKPHTAKHHGAAATETDSVAMQHSSSFFFTSEEGLEWLRGAVPPGSCDGLDSANFRANIVLKGTRFPDEDRWVTFRVGSIPMRRSMMCSRCPFTTINEHGRFRESGEPLATLRRLRSCPHDHCPEIGNKPMFGLRMFHEAQGAITVGDRVTVLSRCPTPTFVSCM